MALTGRRPAEIFFSASFSLPRQRLPSPALLFDGQLKTRQAPGTNFEPYPIPVLADPKKIIQALDTLRDLKSFSSPKAVNTTSDLIALPQFFDLCLCRPDDVLFDRTDQFFHALVLVRFVDD